MKQIATFKKISFLILLCLAGSVKGQIHPLAFSTIPTTTNSNWYKDYVGLRFEVLSPAAVAGDKEYTTANDGSGAAGMWGGTITTPIVNTQVIMPEAGDSLAGSPITTAMAGKIALIYRGGGIGFSDKALAAQSVGAIACVIVNNVPGPPAGMGAGTSGGSVTIPVFMISKADGDAIDAQYCAGVTVTMTITTWGQNYFNDLGFVPQGIAGWHSYAIPYNQLTTGAGTAAYYGMDGAFVANYGLHNATHVKVNDTLRFTPSSGSTSLLHTDVSPTLALFHPLDSIYAMLAPSEYAFLPVPGVGRFDLKYTISSDSVDAYSGDNTATTSFYASDSVYSKGQYDFVGNVPERAIYEAPSGGTSDYLWGPMYFVANAGTSISSAQFSIAASVPGPITFGSMNIYAFKWVDGSGGQPLDGLVQNGELSLISLGVYVFSPTDTSLGVFKVQMGDPVTGIPGLPIMLDANSWYYIAAEVPAGNFLACDGQQSSYPRVYSRYHASGTIDYSNFFWPGDYSTGINPMVATPGQGESPCPFPETAFINSIDSFNYSEQKGLIPAVAMIANNNPAAISGPDSLCAGSAITLSDLVTGGTWSSSSTGIATAGITSGIITGVSAGPVTITYTYASGFATKTITVNPVPLAITGTMNVCAGSTISLGDATAGGTWSSGSTGIATVVAGSGSVSGVSAGPAIITYTLGTGCSAHATITVNTLPAAITGTMSACPGLTTTLSDATSGGSWSSSSTGVATVISGTVTGVSTGTAIIAYTLLTGCFTTTDITVNPLPVAGTITGTANVCPGLSVTLSETVTGGTWSSENTALATVDGSGAVTAVSTGTVNITYAITNSCGTVNATFSINVLSAAICAEYSSAASAIPTAVNVFPNPGDGSFNLLVSSAIEEQDVVTITNIVGEKVKEFIIATNKTTDIKLEQPSGIYFLSVATTGGRYVSKVMIE